ncbi:Gfo/Idh/MocA family protein [Halalkalibacter sp. AB-rgal2]|uniref:Gfo/Idh/MocA family protein n=1 Tax=Halalkalibacter sp. AB-rgal2 TaxID=3242695 RepID=UPI00359D5D20
MIQSPLKFAVIGCGRIAKKHIEALTELPETSLVAVCDTKEDRANKWAQELNIPYYTDYHSMLQAEDIDVVSILTPSGLHAAHTIDIVNCYGKHIVCEKPICLRLEDADRMIAACKRKKVRLFVVLQNRLNSAITSLKEAIDDHAFGKIVLATVRLRWSRQQHYYDQDEWRGTWSLDGGCLTNQASHHVDLLQWLLGMPKEVSANIATRLLNIEVEDTATALLTFADGALGIIEATTATRPIDTEGSISILGEKGMAEIGGFAVNEIKRWQFTHSTQHPIPSSQNEFPDTVYGFGHKKFLDHVSICLRNGEPSMFDGIHAKNSLALIHAIYEASDQKRPVKLTDGPHFRKLGLKG